MKTVERLKLVGKIDFLLTSLPVLIVQTIYIYIYMMENQCCMVFTTERFSEVAIESWPEWDLNPQQLNSVETL